MWACAAPAHVLLRALHVGCAEDSYRKNAMIDQELALLDILDTAGQEEFSSMQDEWIRVGNGFMLVYSVTTRNTFDELHRLREKILRAHNVDHMPMYVCPSPSPFPLSPFLVRPFGRAISVLTRDAVRCVQCVGG